MNESWLDSQRSTSGSRIDCWRRDAVAPSQARWSCHLTVPSRPQQWNVAVFFLFFWRVWPITAQKLRVPLVLFLFSWLLCCSGFAAVHRAYVTWHGFSCELMCFSSTSCLRSSPRCHFTSAVTEQQADTGAQLRWKGRTCCPTGFWRPLRDLLANVSP